MFRWTTSRSKDKIKTIAPVLILRWLRFNMKLRLATVLDASVMFCNEFYFVIGLLWEDLLEIETGQDSGKYRKIK